MSLSLFEAKSRLNEVQALLESEDSCRKGPGKYRYPWLSNFKPSMTAKDFHLSIKKIVNLSFICAIISEPFTVKCATEVNISVIPKWEQ